MKDVDCTFGTVKRGGAEAKEVDCTFTLPAKATAAQPDPVASETSQPEPEQSPAPVSEPRRRWK